MIIFRELRIDIEAGRKHDTSTCQVSGDSVTTVMNSCSFLGPFQRRRRSKYRMWQAFKQSGASPEQIEASGCFCRASFRAAVLRCCQWGGTLQTV